MSVSAPSARRNVDWQAIVEGLDDGRRSLDYFGNGLMRVHDFRNSSSAARRLIEAKGGESARRMALAYLKRTA